MLTIIVISIFWVQKKLIVFIYAVKQVCEREVFFLLCMTLIHWAFLMR